MLGACAVVGSWVVGIGLWGAPESGFGAVSPVFNWAFLVLVGAPAMAVAALADGATLGRRGGWRTAGIAVWVAAVVALMWPTSFVHFGGFCMDASDVCVVRWPGRVAGLVIALGLLVAGWLVALAIGRWQTSRRAVPSR